MITSIMEGYFEKKNEEGKGLLRDVNHVELLVKLLHKVNEEEGTLVDKCQGASSVMYQIKTLDTWLLVLREFLTNQDECLPVPFLWALENEDLLHIPVYIVMKPGIINDLVDKLMGVLFDNFGEGIVISLIKPTFIAVKLKDPAFSQLSYKFQTLFINKFLGKILNGCKTSLVSKLCKEHAVSSTLLLSFLNEILHHFLCFKDEGKEYFDINYAVGDQINWTYNIMPAGITEFTKELLSCFVYEDVLKSLYDLLVYNRTHNFKWVLVVVSTLIVTNPNAAVAMKELLAKWLKEAVVKESVTFLAAVLLITRQCFAESVQPFNSYGAWFSSLNIILENADEFRCFFDVLTELVPHEPSLYLKIHINKVPSVPVGAHIALSDYILLAKTRLDYLKETTDYIGLFGEYKTSGEVGREADITKVLSHFEQTGEIMQTVVEASVFRRKYYEQVFLKDLLQPVTDPTHPRYRFIEKLSSAGKIPFAIYTSWRLRHGGVK